MFWELWFNYLSYSFFCFVNIDEKEEQNRYMSNRLAIWFRASYMYAS